MIRALRNLEPYFTSGELVLPDEIPSLAASIAFMGQHATEWANDAQCDEVAEFEAETARATQRELQERMVRCFATLAATRLPVLASTLDGRPAIAQDRRGAPLPIRYGMPRLTEAVGYVIGIGSHNGWLVMIDDLQSLRSSRKAYRATKFHVPLFHPETFDPLTSLRFQER